MRRKVKVTYPTAKSGGSYGESRLNSNANPEWYNSYQNRFGEEDIQVNQSLKPVDVEDANLEAENGETAYVPDESGIPALFKIGGERHYNGGTPLNLPEDSFIFSRDNKMKIGGQILESFGKKKDTKDKFTPAKLSSQYKINDFRKTLADPNSDDTQRDTAELMIANYNLKLAKLGLVQESTKGFPDGIPAIAMPYLEMIQVDPSQFVNPQDQGQSSEQMSKYGGLIKAQGGLNVPKKGIPQPPEPSNPWIKAGKVAGYVAGSELAYQGVKKFGPLLIKDLEERIPGGYAYAKELVKKYGPKMFGVLKKMISSNAAGVMTRAAVTAGAMYLPEFFKEDAPSPYYPTAKPVIKPKPKVQFVPPSIELPLQTNPYGEEYVDEEEPVYNAPKRKFDTIRVAGDNPYLQKKLGGDIPKYQGGGGGGVVTTYDDGTSSTRYANGKIEIKDAQGNILQTIAGNTNKTSYPSSNSYDPYSGASDFLEENSYDPNTVLYKEQVAGNQAINPQGGYGKQNYEGFKANNKELLDKFKKEKGIDYNKSKLEDVKWFQQEFRKQTLADAKAANYSDIEANFLADKLSFKEGQKIAGDPRFVDSEHGDWTDTRVRFKFKPKVSADSKKDIVSGPGPTSGGVGNPYFAPKPRWWAQDKIKTAGAAWDKLNIKKYNPWQATPGYALKEGTFYDPTRELAANAEMVNQGVTGASTFSGPQGYAATASMLQGQGAKNAADIMGRYNNMNVSEANMLSGVNTGIMNQTSQQRANAATQLFDKQTIANQQFDNSKNMARQNLRQSFMDAITNRANTYNLNTMYPQYAVNPSNGGMVYNPTGSNRRPTMDGVASDVESQINKIRKSSISAADQDLWIKSLFGKNSDNQTG